MARLPDEKPGPSRILIYMILLAAAALFIIPFAVIVSNSFRTLDEITRTSVLGLPTRFIASNWREAWSELCFGGVCSGIQPYFWNSVRLVIPATILSTALGAYAGYILALWRFKGSGIVFAIITFGIFLPGHVKLIPWVLTLRELNLTNTTSGLVLIHTIQGMSFTTLFCRNFFVGIPDALVKAATIDGAGLIRIFFRIVLPIAPPILIVCVIWQFTHIWNEFLFAVTFSTGDKQPVTAALIALAVPGHQQRIYNVESAAVLIAALPTILIYLFGGRYFVRGLTAGAVK